MDRLLIDHEDSGKRLDVFTTEQLPTLSRAYVATLIDSRQVLVNNIISKPGYKLRSGDKVKINFNLGKVTDIADIDLPILYQDDDVLVIDKPAGIISHSRGKYWNEPSVASFVRQITHQPGERAGIVHRLDRVTSGVMICTKNHETMTWLQRQFAARKVKKTYTAIVSGHLNPPDAVIDMPIERNPKAPATFRVGSNGKPATTTYSVMYSNSTSDQVNLTPLTGRTHQLRVHLAHQGHSIVGDHLYGGIPYSRLLLHAKSLELELPGRKVHVFESSTPPEFHEYMEQNNG